MNNAYYKNERATEHCARMTLSNLVDLRRTPDVGRILAQTPTSSTSLSRNQRQINVDRVSFDGRFEQNTESLTRYGLGLRELRTAFKANSYGRCFPRLDRKSLTRHGGSVNKYQPGSQNVLKIGSGDVADSAGWLRRYKQCWKSRLIPASPIFKAFWQKPGIGPKGRLLSPVAVRHSMRVPIRIKVKPRLRKRTRELVQQYCPIRPKARSYA